MKCPLRSSPQGLWVSLWHKKRKLAARSQSGSSSGSESVPEVVDIVQQDVHQLLTRLPPQKFVPPLLPPLHHLPTPSPVRPRGRRLSQVSQLSLQSDWAPLRVRSAVAQSSALPRNEDTAQGAKSPLRHFWPFAVSLWYQRAAVMASKVR